MLSIFKPKSLLKDLIPEDYIDIHSHLLPGLDDGAKTLEDTLRLTRELHSFGFSQFITTPHIITHVWNNTNQNIKKTETTTISELGKHNFSLPFKAVAEYMIDDHFVELFKSGDILTLKKNYVLIEFSYLSPPIRLYEILFDMQVAGYIPVLAHPERYLFCHHNLEEYNKLKRAGCLFQLNLLAVVGYYGEVVTKITEKLLQKGMYNFVGSDVHHDNHIAGFNRKVKLKDLKPLNEVIANNQFFKMDSLK